ncbi:MAG: Phospho-2-dehydro-3-deoxyheptonate aldolase, Tyr-sensitive [Chlamydiales bacterium]|nr:Phospho-2-dehydro-3-deoxyheptonate aldolase, Tyr-sensitive [Chlamydiales bacterium]
MWVVMTLLSLTPDDFDTILPTPHELQEEIPLTSSQAAFIQESRATINAILTGLDDRKLLIVGPCSIHDTEAALEYARKLSILAEEVSEQFYVIMRAYVEKPRTITGWKGLLYDPHLDGSHNLGKGIRLTRRLFSDLTEMCVPIASELLEITTSHYFSEFLSWGCIGARTSSSPPHRQLAASLDFPVGFKNTVDGTIDHAVHGVLSASTPHVFLGLSTKGKMTRIQSKGNAHCHIVLRGGYGGPNYDSKSIMDTVERCQQAGIRDKLVIDCSHDNCEKRHLKQVSAFQALVELVAEGNQSIAGLMLESHLVGGSQPVSDQLRYGVSITDPCLDWPTTRQVILQAAAKLNSESLCLI